MSFLLRNLHTIFHRGWTSLHFHQQWMRVPFLKLYSCQHLLILFVFIRAISWDEVMSQYGFNFRISYNKWYWTYSHMSVGHMDVFFREVSVELLYPFFNWIICCWIREVLYKVWKLIPYQTCDIKYFPQSIGWFFIFVIASFEVQKL